MKEVEVLLLGGFEVRVDGEPVRASAWTQARARDLVKLLALAPGHRLLRDQVVEALWPQLDAEAGAANLYKAAHHARRAIGPADAVVLRSGEVLLAPDVRVETDVERFEAKGDPGLYPGELLPQDRYAEWSEEPRARLRASYLEALRALGRWEELADEEPADEAAQLAVMRARLAAGNRRGALEAFERLETALGELGMRPSMATLAFHARIAGGAALDRALAAVELELAGAPVAERADLLATRADLLLAMGNRGAPAAYGDAAAAAGPEGMALRIRQAWAQLAGGDAAAARATLAPLTPSSDAERVAHLLAGAAAAWFEGDVQAARRAAAEAQSLSLAAGLEREARTAVQIQAIVAHSTGDWPDALNQDFNLSLRAPELADTLFDGHLCVAQYALIEGDAHARLRTVAEELHAGAVRSGARRAQAFAATILGEVALAAGQLEQAGERLGEAVRVSREIGAVSAEALASVRLGEVARARGEVAQGNSLLADALVLSGWSPVAAHLHPIAHTALLRAADDPEVGRRRLEDAEAHLRDEENGCVYCETAFRFAAAVAAARAGQPDPAAAFLSDAEAAAALWPEGSWRGALDEARAELAWARGDAAAARDLLRAAGRAFARHGSRLDADRVEARLAVLA